MIYMMSCVFGKSYFPILVNRLGSLGRVSLSMIFSASFCSEACCSSLFPFLTRHEGVG